MKKTSLHPIHQAAGATMAPFAGWDMPISYQGTVGEVEAVRTGAGIFDVSHMGEARVSGPRAFAFVQHVTTNDVSRLAPGKAQYSLLLNELGGVIDDIIVYCQSDEDFLIVLNAGCKDKDWDWLLEKAKTNSGVTLTDESDRTALLAIQGTAAVDMVAGLLGQPEIAETPRFQFISLMFRGAPLIISRTGYTGEDGFEIFCDWEDAPSLWNLLTGAGAQPAGLGARDVLRLEAAYPLYGHELDAESSPLESGVGWAIKTGKGEFIGRETVLARKQEGLTRQLVGLRMAERAIPREQFSVMDEEGTLIGEVTSGTWSPTCKAGIALARLQTRYTGLGTMVNVEIRGRRAAATVVPLPFYRNGV